MQFSVILFNWKKQNPAFISFQKSKQQKENAENKNKSGNNTEDIVTDL